MRRKRARFTKTELQEAVQIHAVLMAKIEKAIGRIYAVKDNHLHQQVWWLVAALEAYKGQTNLMFDVLWSGLLTDDQLPQWEEIRNKVSESLDHLMDITKPMICEQFPE